MNFASGPIKYFLFTCASFTFFYFREPSRARARAVKLATTGAHRWQQGGAQARLGYRAHIGRARFNQSWPVRTGDVRPRHRRRRRYGGGAVACLGAGGLAGHSLWEVWPHAVMLE
jgi:hypothetical protein